MSLSDDQWVADYNASKAAKRMISREEYENQYPI
jgi:hypothetical protein